MNQLHIAALLSVAIFSAAPAFAAAQEIKPGLYQIVTRSSGDQAANERLKRQQADLAKLSAEDKAKLAEINARMEKMMAGLSAAERKQMQSLMGETGGTAALQDQNKTVNADGSTTVKACITKEMIELRDLVFQQKSCKNSNGLLSGGVMKLTYLCSSPPSKGDGELRITGPDAFTTKLKMVSTKPGNKDSNVIASTATLLSPSCGATTTR